MRQTTEQIITAAQGWLDLGCPADALKELQKVPSPAVNFDVLRLRYEALSASEQWAAADFVADATARLYPQRPEPWLWRAEIAYRCSGDSKALDRLIAASRILPNNELIQKALQAFAP